MEHRFDVSAPWLNRLLEGKPRRTLRAVDGVDFDIQPSQTLALAGEAGCGKSTSAKLVTGFFTLVTVSFLFYRFKQVLKNYFSEDILCKD